MSAFPHFASSQGETLRYTLFMNRTPLAPKEYYHIYNRGTDKRKIFLSKRDHERFLGLLYAGNSTKAIRLDDMFKSSPSQGFTLRTLLEKAPRTEPLIDLVAYCLMPNHFHILVREREAGGISRFMQKMTTGYTMYFNKRYKRTGALFQGAFRSEHIKEDRYLKYLLSYIHLNPIKLIEPKWKERGITDKEKAEEYLEHYAYSSYLDYLGESRLENKILSMDVLPNYFETTRDFKTNIMEWLDFKKS